MNNGFGEPLSHCISNVGDRPRSVAQRARIAMDMNYMNTHQSAHGDREFGFIGTRMRKERKVVVGHWQDPKTVKQIDGWCRAALGWAESQSMKVVRFGDNMRHVAVTEGDKVAAQITFGYEVHAHGLQELADVVESISDGDVAAFHAKERTRWRECAFSSARLVRLRFITCL